MFLITLGVFISIILIGRLIQLGKILMSLNISIVDILYLIFYLSPFFLFVLMPVSGMLALFVTFQRMSTDNELVALRSGGISLYNILPCPIFILLIFTGINFFISFHGISWGMERFNSYLIDLAQKKTKLSIRPGMFNLKIPGFVIYAQRVSENSEVLTNVFIKQGIEKDREIIIVAPQGFLKWLPGKKELYFSILNGRIYENPFDSRGSYISFGKYEIKLDLNRVLKSLKIHTDEPKYMSFSALKKKLSVSPKRNSSYVVQLIEEKYKRIAIPTSCMILGLLAIPLGWLLEGMKKFYGTIIVVLVFFVYYALFAMGKSLVEGGVLAPVIGIWGPNILFFILTIFAFYFAEKEKFKFSTRD
ncbi:LPS export ABC transporter permease LptF [Desulfothermus okinawensis JCM 13304]